MHVVSFKNFNYENTNDYYRNDYCNQYFNCSIFIEEKLL